MFQKVKNYCKILTNGFGQTEISSISSSRQDRGMATHDECYFFILMPCVDSLITRKAGGTDLRPELRGGISPCPS